MSNWEKAVYGALTAAGIYFVFAWSTSSGDVSWWEEIGEGQDEVGVQGKDLVDLSRGKGAHPWLFAAGLWRPDGSLIGKMRCFRPAELCA